MTATAAPHRGAGPPSPGGLEVSRIGLGAVGMAAFYTGAGRDDAQSIRTIQRAVDLGVTHLDTAEVYGPYVNEELVGRAVRNRRDEVVLATTPVWGPLTIPDLYGRCRYVLRGGDPCSEGSTGPGSCR